MYVADGTKIEFMVGYLYFYRFIFDRTISMAIGKENISIYRISFSREWKIFSIIKDNVNKKRRIR